MHILVVIGTVLATQDLFERGAGGSGRRTLQFYCLKIGSRTVFSGFSLKVLVHVCT